MSHKSYRHRRPRGFSIYEQIAISTPLTELIINNYYVRNASIAIQTVFGQPNAMQTLVKSNSHALQCIAILFFNVEFKIISHNAEVKIYSNSDMYNGVRVYFNFSAVRNGFKSTS